MFQCKAMKYDTASAIPKIAAKTAFCLPRQAPLEGGSVVVPKIASAPSDGGWVFVAACIARIFCLLIYSPTLTALLAPAARRCVALPQSKARLKP